MPLVISSQMMDTCKGENRMKISCPYPEKKMWNYDVQINFKQYLVNFCFLHGTACSNLSNAYYSIRNTCNILDNEYVSHFYFILS